MTFGNALRDFVERMLDNVGITSANPEHTNYVKRIIPVAPSFLDEIFRTEVVRVIQEEVKIQMAEFREDPKKQSSPEGSSTPELQGPALEAFQAIKNPGGLVAKGLKVLPHAAAVLFAIQISKYVFEEITKAGGAMDLRWRRQMENEFNAFLDRQTQRNTQIGTRQVVIQSAAGFIQMNGAANENTLRQIRNGGVDGTRIARVGFVDHAMGLF